MPEPSVDVDTAADDGVEASADDGVETSGDDRVEASGDRVREVLAEAVTALGGEERSGQVQMAEAVATAMRERQHLLVQAGTGTGKSLAYLVPALLHDERVVVATATLALQHQLVERDLPRLVEAVGGRRDLDASYAVLKGRSNYACLHRIRAGIPADDQDTLLEVPSGSLGESVMELRDWAEQDAEQGGSGERDRAPRHQDRAWRQVSVTARECLGRSKCPFGEECFAELARDRAAESQLVVTNHSLLAIDAIEGIPMIPDYDVVVVDEAHEVAARITQAATDELSALDVERAARRARKYVDEGDDLGDAGEALADAIAALEPGRLDQVPADLSDALVLVRDAAREALGALGREKADKEEGDSGRTQAKAMLQELFDHAARMVEDRESDVLWRNDRDPNRGGPQLCVAPLQVWGPMRDRLLREKTVVFTSATLMLGGDFAAVAGSVGLRPTERVLSEPTPRDAAPAASRPAPPRNPGAADGNAEADDSTDNSADDRASDESGDPDADKAEPWVGLDVGSPFDYGRQAILYVARHLPPPGRDGLGKAQLDEIVDLVDAADGRTLGLFSSRRAAEQAAEEVRERLPHLTTLAQGEAQLAELGRLFVDDPHTCLFGTLSLWQGLDVPGETCQLVLIDRIPFPRPDDPLMSARQRAADRAGGNGFMQVAATHAALLLAQGTGRLIRTTTDRGVVAVLDPRLATARYGGFLRASLPPMWSTHDPQLVRDALKRLAGA